MNILQIADATGTITVAFIDGRPFIMGRSDLFEDSDQCEFDFFCKLASYYCVHGVEGTKVCLNIDGEVGAI